MRQQITLIEFGNFETKFIASKQNLVVVVELREIQTDQKNVLNMCVVLYSIDEGNFFCVKKKIK